MDVQQPVLLLVVSASGAMLLGALVLWLGRSLALLAHPNARSSHKIPTPTAGGVCFVIPILIWLFLAPMEFGERLAWSAAVLALLGLVDDVRELPASLKFLIQIGVIAALVLGYWAEWPWWLQAIAILSVAWFVNLLNFMDGIDGITGAQTLFYFSAVVFLVNETTSWIMLTPWVLLGGMVGFLGYNWPPARFFMGDVGSLFLGLVIAAFAIELARTDTLPLAGSAILLAVFWFDATYTLAVRLITGQAIAQAHRSHLYQRLATRKGHRWTTLAFLLYAALWLLPLAWLTLKFSSPELQILAILTSVLPLAFLAWRFRAGMQTE